MFVNVSYQNTVHSYGVSRGMLIQNLKEEISEKHNLQKFKLLHDQTELQQGCPVTFYLKTYFKLCFDNKEVEVKINDVTMDVEVENPQDQRVIKENVTPKMTVGQLKESLARELMATQGKWTLKKDGREVPDGVLVKTHLGVKTFTVNMQDMQVIIKYNGGNISILTKSDMTILDFKRLCSLKIKLEVDEIGLTFNGEELENYIEIDDTIMLVAAFLGDEAIACVANELEKKKTVENRTLASYGIDDGTVLLVSLRLRGGSC